MTELFSHPDAAPGLERTVETDVPFPPELAAVIDEAPAFFKAAEEAPERDDEVHDYAAPPMPAQLPAQPLFAGTYAAYDDGHDGAVLVLQPHGGETQRKHIPAAMIKMAMRFAGGNPFGNLFGG